MSLTGNTDKCHSSSPSENVILRMRDIVVIVNS